MYTISYTEKESRSFVIVSFKLVDRNCLFKCLSGMIDSISPRKRSDSPHLPRRRLCRQSRLSRGVTKPDRSNRSAMNTYLLLLLMQVESSMLLHTRQLWRTSVVSLHAVIHDKFLIYTRLSTGDFPEWTAQDWGPLRPIEHHQRYRRRW